MNAYPRLASLCFLCLNLIACGGVASQNNDGTDALEQEARSGGKRSKDTGSFTLRNVDPTDLVVNFGDAVTFDVQSTATWPMVQMRCFQGSTLVFLQGVGFYGGYPFTQIFTLEGYLWPSGAASCTAELYSANSDGSYRSQLATMTFGVAD
jgi:hypothetical protein